MSERAREEGSELVSRGRRRTTQRPRPLLTPRRVVMGVEVSVESGAALQQKKRKRKELVPRRICCGFRPGPPLSRPIYILFWHFSRWVDWTVARRRNPQLFPLLFRQEKILSSLSSNPSTHPLLKKEAAGGSQRRTRRSVESPRATEKLRRRRWRRRGCVFGRRVCLCVPSL